MNDSCHNFDYMMTQTQMYKTNGTIQYPMAGLPAPPPLTYFYKQTTQSLGFELQSSKYTTFLEEIYTPPLEQMLTYEDSQESPLPLLPILMTNIWTFFYYFTDM